MAHVKFRFDNLTPKVVGSSGSSSDLRDLNAGMFLAACDIVEVRLDLMLANEGAIDRQAWAHLMEIPLLFTVRRGDEGGAGNLGASERMEMLGEILDDASLIDIEVESIAEMHVILDEIRERGIPWVASSHDFKKLPANAFVVSAAKRAEDAGAAVFKIAAMLDGTEDLARLADFQLTDHRLPVATMGMGPLAPVSRLLCAQAGSLLNYGYLGANTTAPGQWDSTLLKTAISRLDPIKP
jgi:3-dehydroquinate dehydratase-1